MKTKRLAALLLALLMLAGLLSGCGEQKSVADSSAPLTPEPTAAAPAGYHRLNLYWAKAGVDYSKADVWLWFDGAEGHGYPFTACDYGVVCAVDVPESVTRVGFLVRYDCSEPCGSSWGSATKDVEADRYLTVTEDLSVWLVSGDENVYSSEAEASGGAGTPTAQQAAAEGALPEEYAVNTVSFSNYAPTEDNARVFYEIFVGSFSDSDGDGTGDLRGIINRMDYLNDGDPQSGKSLGIEGIWLTPVYESPSYHKYDVTDYYSVDNIFGTNEDLAELAALCEARNVKLILDLPINHTGDHCHWFTEFCKAHREGDTSNPYYDFYTWSTKDNLPAGRTFKQISGCGDFYECNFDSSMPELNFDSEAVREEVLSIARYWLDLGVDGFRFDAAKYVYFGDHTESASFWDWYLGVLREEYPGLYTVAEVWDSDSVTGLYFSSTNCFDFTAAGSEGLIGSAAKGGKVGGYTSYVESYLAAVKAENADAMYVPFLSNHDQDRIAGGLTVSSGNLQMAANLYLLGPGSPFIYYGEEIGMKGSRGGANTDANRRLAMLWGDGDTVRDPDGSTYDSSKQTNGTVASQLGDSGSLYQYYKTLILLRAANPEIARGEYTAVVIDGNRAGGFIATLDGSSVLVLHNTSDTPVTVELSALEGVFATELTAYIGLGNASLNGSTLTLEAQTSAILR